MGVDDYNRIVSPIEGRMMRTVWRILGNTQDAEDALQSAFPTVWLRIRKVRRHPNPTALVLRICANAAYDVLRARLASPQSGLPRDPEDSAGSPDESMIQEERRQAVRQAISQLSRKQAVAVMLRDIEDQPYAEVAQALGCRESTARKHVARGRKRLRSLLSDVIVDTSRQGAPL